MVMRRTGPQQQCFRHKAGGHSGGSTLVCGSKDRASGQIQANPGCGVAQLAFLQAGISGELFQVLFPSNEGGRQLKPARGNREESRL